MKLWIARDYSGALWLYSSKPLKYGMEFFPQEDADTWVLSLKMYPEVTFKNSPQMLINEPIK